MEELATPPPSLAPCARRSVLGGDSPASHPFMARGPVAVPWLSKWRLRRWVTVAALVSTVIVPSSKADDWCRWRGPHQDGVSQESGWLDRWAADGPEILWTAAVGTGFSSLAVCQGRLYTIGNEENTDTLICLDAASGQTLWKYSYPCPRDAYEFEGGPTSTPTVDQGAVYGLSRRGDLYCLEASTGKTRWSKNIASETGIRIPAWGFAGSPRVHGDVLLLNIGDAGAAVDKASGDLLWASADKDAGYATPVVRVDDGQATAIFASGKSFVGVDVLSGRERWRQRWLTTFGCNAADPIVAGDRIFLSSGYNRGCALLRIDGAEPTVVWKNKEMQNQLTPSLLIDGFLYGVHGDVAAGASLRCMELESGQVQWDDASFRAGAVAAADGRLIVISDSGELLIGPASAQGFVPSARAPVVSGKCWTVPVLCDGRIYCRTADGTVACVSVMQNVP